MLVIEKKYYKKNKNARIISFSVIIIKYKRLISKGR